jgi:hypothetical protein
MSTEDSVLLIITVSEHIADGNWNYPRLIDNRIVSKHMATVIRHMCKRYADSKTSFWHGDDFECTLSDFKIRYIDDPANIRAFKSMYGRSHGSCELYDNLNALKSCYRQMIERSVKDDSYDYDPECDGLNIGKLKIVDKMIVVDPLQALDDNTCSDQYSDSDSGSDSGMSSDSD